MGELTAAYTRYIEIDKKLAGEYRIASRSEDMRRQDQAIWEKFSNYLGSLDPWKAEPDHIAAYCASEANRGLSPHSIENILSSLNYTYQRLGKGHVHGQPGTGVRKISPCHAELVQATMRGIRRVHARPPQRKKPLMLDSLEKIIDRQPDSLVGIRNKALLTLCWAAALRGTTTLSRCR